MATDYKNQMWLGSNHFQGLYTWTSAVSGNKDNYHRKTHGVSIDICIALLCANLVVACTFCESSQRHLEVFSRTNNKPTGPTKNKHRWQEQMSQRQTEEAQSAAWKPQSWQTLTYIHTYTLRDWSTIHVSQFSYVGLGHSGCNEGL